ncbi:FlgK family flagellar hook-associated protein [Halarcobacter sp.]|uniref:flagellar hook-associated protein FlgK n=1 Tax=Halarcobacter sp. TaxID=2321133 RepID=UPI002AA8D05E|nr:flagellar basal body rod C-terminal domain-containing protein [Halarcobacter sp.]
MMDSLYIAQSGLKTSRYAIDVTSNNLANENTEGYKKRVVQTSEVASIRLNIGNGVSFDGVNRTTSPYLYTQILSQNSYSNYYTQQNSTLSSAEQIFKETANSGFSTSLSNFFTAAETLRGDPSSATYKAELNSQSTMIINNIKSIYADLEELQDDNLSLLKDQVDEVNSILEKISHINEKMVDTGESNELLDKRDQLENQLSNYGNIDISTENGNYVLEMGGENLIFNTTSFHELSVKEEYVSQKDIYTTTDLNDTNFSDGDVITLTLNNDISIDITANVSGGTNFDLKQQIVDKINNDSQFGNLQARLDTANNLIIESIEGGEDNIFDLKINVAGSIVGKDTNVSVEATDNVSVVVYNNELNLSGGSFKSLSENLTSETSEILYYKRALNDFTKAFVEAYAQNSDTTMFKGASVNTFEYVKNSAFNLSGSDLEGISQLQWAEDINIDSRSSEVTSFKEFYKNLLEDVSVNNEDNISLKEAQDAVLNSMTVTYEKLTKVNSDEEMINLMQYQAAYEANAKIITAVDEMLQTILNM